MIDVPIFVLTGVQTGVQTGGTAPDFQPWREALRDWRLAKVWLLRQLSENEADEERHGE